VLVAHKVGAEGEVIDGSLLAAKIVDADLLEGNAIRVSWRC
jgi:hypothetical protein